MIQKEKKTQVILENATHEGDTGSPEVQIAILTARINELTDHLRTHKHDNPGKESTFNVGRLGLTPGLGRSSGKEKGYPLQYSGL